MITGTKSKITGQKILKNEDGTNVKHLYKIYTEDGLHHFVERNAGTLGVIRFSPEHLRSPFVDPTNLKRFTVTGEIEDNAIVMRLNV